MIALPPTAVFVNAGTVAVFSVLADLENLDRILSRVFKVRSVSPLPVQEGTLVREATSGPFGRHRSFRFEQFVPPRARLCGNERKIVWRLWVEGIV